MNSKRSIMRSAVAAIFILLCVSNSTYPAEENDSRLLRSHAVQKAPQWTRVIPGELSAWAGDCLVGPDGDYLILGSVTLRTDDDRAQSSTQAVNKDLYLLKLDDSGNIISENTYGGVGSQESAGAIAESNNGDLFLVGTSHMGYDDTTTWAAYVVKTNPLGDELWNKSFRCNGRNTEALAAQATSDGGCVITGHATDEDGKTDDFLAKLNKDGHIVWNRLLIASIRGDSGAVKITPDGGYVIAGSTTPTGAEWADMYLLKTDKNGVPEWSNHFGGSERDWAYDVMTTPDGGYLIAGGTLSFGAGETDGWVVKTDAKGNRQWSRAIGGEGRERLWSIERAPDDCYVLAGSTTSFGAGGEDMLLVCIDSRGGVMWSQTFGGARRDRAFCVRQAVDGGFIVVGSTMSFGNNPLSIYVVKTSN